MFQKWTLLIHASPESLLKVLLRRTQTPNKKCSLVETQHFMVYINIYIWYIWFTYMIYMLICFLTPGICSKLSCFKPPWSCPFLKHVAPSMWKSVQRACFVKFLRWSFVFSRISKDKMTNLKIQGFFEKNDSTTRLNFFWNSPMILKYELKKNPPILGDGSRWNINFKRPLAH